MNSQNAIARSKKTEKRAFSAKNLLTSTALVAAAALMPLTVHAGDPVNPNDVWIFQNETATDSGVGYVQYGSGAGDIIIDNLTQEDIGVNGHVHLNADLTVATGVESGVMEILGMLTSTGDVRILDTNGFLFGSNAVVDTQSFAAVGGTLTNAPTMLTDGQMNVKIAPNSSIMIQSGASISVADAGLAAFVAPNISNAGVINAKLGNVVLGAGQQATLDLYGDGLLEVAVSGELGDALIEHSGVINAEGGNVVVTASAAKAAVDNIINVKGVVTVSSATVKGGKIILSGGKKGTVKVSGSLNASGVTGGGVSISGQNVALEDTAVIEVQGNEGEINIFANDTLNLEATLRAHLGQVNTTADRYVLSGAPTIAGFGIVEAGLWNYTQNGSVVVNTPLATMINKQLRYGDMNITANAGDLAVASSLVWGGNNALVMNANNVSVSSVVNANGGDITINNTGILKAKANSLQTTGAGKISLNQNVGGSIQNAMDAIHNTGTGLNTINVAAGTYAETLSVTQDNLSLLGDAQNSVITPNSPGFSVTADNVTIDGFTINAADNGILVTGADNATITNNLITNSTLDGISLVSVTNSTVAGNTINNTADDAISVVGSAGVDVLGNMITGTLPGQGHNGIYVGQATGASHIAGNVISNVSGNGIRIHESAGQTVINNSVTNAGWNGIGLIDSAGSVAQGNDIDGSVKYGIFVHRSAGATVDNNDINNTALSGIRAHHSAGTQVTNNRVGLTGGVDNITQNAIHVSESANTLVSTNTVQNSVLNGIVLNNADGSTVNNNIVDNTTLDGIEINHSDDTQLLSNVIGSTGAISGEGIDVNGSARINVDGNTISNTNSYGISARNSIDAIINGNTIDNTRLSAVYVKAGGNSVVTNNVIGSLVGKKVRNGIVIDGSINSMVADNQISNASLNAIEVNGASGTSVLRNTVNVTGADAIEVNTGNNVTVSDNMIGTLAGNIGAQGIDVNGSGNAMISGNTINKTRSFGMSIDRSNDATIDANFINNTRLSGVRVIDSNSADITNNMIGTLAGFNNIGTLFNSENAGIQMSGSQNAIVTGNTVKNANQQGIYATGASNSVFQNNSVDFARRQGMLITSSDNVSIDANKVSNVGQGGIYLFDNVTNSTVTNNIINNTGLVNNLSGILVVQSHDIDVLNNTISNTSYDGVHVGLNNTPFYYSSNVTVDGNTISGVRRNGVFASSGLLSASNNTINNTGLSGIEANKSDGVQIVDNMIGTLTGNIGTNGIVLNDLKGATVATNNISATGDAGVKLSAVDAVSILTNTISNSNGHGILSDGTKNGDIVVADNTLIDNVIGAEFRSGNIDLTGLSNTISGGDVSLRFAPSGTTTDLTLVGNTLGSTVFETPSRFYVDLDNGAFFNAGVPTNISGVNASFDGVIPASFTNSILPRASLDSIENLLNDFDDTGLVGQIFAGLTPDLAIEDFFNSFTQFDDGTAGLNLTVTGLPLVNGSTRTAQNLAGIAPFAGSASDLANIAPAAGGDASDVAAIEPAAGEEAGCWGDVLSAAVTGNTVSYNFSGSAEDMLNDANTCGSSL